MLDPNHETPQVGDRHGKFVSIGPERARIVGIGASAGGLEALKLFFGALPQEVAASFVVAIHHAPGAGTSLVDILSRQCPLPVISIGKKPVAVKPGHVYVAANGHYLKLSGEKLQCVEQFSTDVTLPIDFFFRSLAEEQKSQAIGIILSGSGSDGTLGLQAIKGETGMAMAQDLKSAQYSDMPASAIASGLPDYVLPPQEMPQQLLTYLNGAVRIENEKPAFLDSLPEMLSILRQHTGNDFAAYKTNTLCRRIERRMNVHHIIEPPHYIRYLRENPHELDLLFKELLIGVTAFFRDPPAYESMVEQLKTLLKDKKSGDSVRVWVTGCSTGEEAYSLAILFQEYMEAEHKTLNVQIFATDLDDKAINHARAGLYSEGIALDVSSERLKKFFVHEDSHYRVKKNVREMVVFAIQNLIQDPSFTKLDLITCRNLLIYLDASLQKKIIPLFHYSLREGGVLFLGSSETVGTFNDLFTPLQSRWKIFGRKEARLPLAPLTRLMEFPRIEPHVTHSPSTAGKSKAPDITELAQKLLLKQHIPPSLIVNDKGDIFFIHGRTGQYLEPPQGAPNIQQNALDMAREGLQLALTSIIRKAATQDGDVEHKNVRVRTNGHFTLVTLRAHKVTEPEALRGLLWISFYDEEEPSVLPVALKPAKAKKIGSENREPLENDQLERELQFIKQSLQNTIEELEASNEEQKSTNEELQSTNEELQSANEELETAKEEMQSLNEELQTVNTELELKINDLSFANDDMKNLLNSTGIATVFLDNDLNIKRFTIQAKKIIHLIATDIGRPISDIVTQLEYDTLVADAMDVLHTLVFKEIEVRARDWSWYLMRIMPYRTAENVIDGLVITFVDITALKKSEILLGAHSTAFQQLQKNTPIEIVESLLRTIEQQSPGIWSSVSLYDEQNHKLHHLAAPTLPDAFNRALDNIDVGPQSTEPCAIAVYHRKHSVFDDIGAHPAPDAFHQTALQYHLKAAWAQPIYSEDKKILGVFTIYYQQAHRASAVEEDLINQTIPLMATALSRTEVQP